VLQDLAARLAIPGLPEWVGLVLLVLGGLVALAYLLMPFSVFGVKGRLDGIEAQLDEIQTDIRALAMRMPDAGPRGRRSHAGAAALEEDWVEPPSVSSSRSDDYVPPRATPPIPPPAHWPDAPPSTPSRGGAGRTEPRLDWPRTPPPR
jgi:hypothetical protein